MRFSLLYYKIVTIDKHMTYLKYFRKALHSQRRELAEAYAESKPVAFRRVR
jgi:hypothetical protein